jgi:hypothetical protein
VNQDAVALAIRIRADLVDVAYVVERTQRLLIKDIIEYLRHVIRNVYTFNLRPSRLKDLVMMLPSCHNALVQDLETFCNFLEALS